jgi:hypothetical protein
VGVAKPKVIWNTGSEVVPRLFAKSIVKLAEVGPPALHDILQTPIAFGAAGLLGKEYVPGNAGPVTTMLALDERVTGSKVKVPVRVSVPAWKLGENEVGNVAVTPTKL